MQPHKTWTEQSETARGIEESHGVQKALEYFIGEKLLNHLEAPEAEGDAEADADFRSAISAFVTEIKTIFERWQLAQYLAKARETEPFDPALFEPRTHPLLGDKVIDVTADEAEKMRVDDIRQCTRELRLVERAREWLLEVEA